MTDSQSSDISFPRRLNKTIDRLVFKARTFEETACSVRTVDGRIIDGRPSDRTN